MDVEVAEENALDRERPRGTHAGLEPLDARVLTEGGGLERRVGELPQPGLGGRREVADRPYREPVDRVFSLTGAGTVVTGTSLWGRLEVNTEVMIMPGRHRTRVRRPHVHGDERTTVEAGERVATGETTLLAAVWQGIGGLEE